MRKLLVIPSIAFIFTLGYFLYLFALPLLEGANASLLVTTPSDKTTVSLNGKTVGTTPYKADRTKPGDYLIKLSADIKIGETLKKITYEFKTSLINSSQTIINREIAPLEQLAGETVIAETGEGISITSNPDQVKVRMDDKDVGQTPLSTPITDGVHKLEFEKDNYLKRELTINKTKGNKLLVSVNLALDFLADLKLLDERQNVKTYSLTFNQTLASEDWADNVFYAQDRYGSPSARLDLLIDTKGSTYSAYPKSLDDKIRTLGQAKEATSSPQILIGYLNKDKTSDLSDAAKKAREDLIKLLHPQVSSLQVQILATPTGFLNVRSAPSLSSSIKGKVNPGNFYDLLEEKTGWYKIKFNNTEGWISSQYASKKG